MRKKSPNEDYEICKRVVSDLLIFLSFITLIIYNVFTSRSNKCTYKVVTPDSKQTMAESTASWSETAQESDEDNKLKLLIHKLTIPLSYY